ncbi:MAG: hypothetical protein HQL74_15595 [Magnetococcales bacterium]|nr:hypothetical protein [Magnetococcales bacterium]
MHFIADLHVHSKYSRATSKNLDLETLSYWAQRKGITLVGTGDFTHPAWRAEIRDHLVPAEEGLFRLRPEWARAVAKRLSLAAPDLPTLSTRFQLTVEIATVYKKGDKTRKVHHLICVPGFAEAEKMVTRLEGIGNLHADGRPILGLDSRDLLEITLEAGEGCYLIPAHIWTPWYSLLGSKSGFDSVEACYGDLAGHIFALETGLSSDPPMNWRISSLDRFRLVSHSDAHSANKLGREATLYDTDLDYFSILKALKSRQGFGGTLEFFPEEGKYHLDGHRKCGVRLTPMETRAWHGLCPVCGKEVTVGVQNRVEALSDRDPEAIPAGRDPFFSLVPLEEILAELEGVAANSRRVQRALDSALAHLGPELHILRNAPLEDIRRHGSERFAEAIARLRRGEVIRQGGFDGEFGVIRLFRPGERL